MATRKQRSGKNGKSDSVAKKHVDKSARPTNGAKPPEWKENLSSYKTLMLLRFENDQQLDDAIDLLWTDDFRTLPHDTPDGKSIIIPAEAVPYFANAGLKFSAKKMLTIDDFTPEEIAKMRR